MDLKAINATQQLRSTVTNVFTFLCDGFKAEDFDASNESSQTTTSVSKDSKKFLFHFQNLLQAVNQDYNEVEKLCNLMSTSAEITSLGPIGALSQDSVLDKTGMYRNVSAAYQWYHKMHDYSLNTSNLMSTHSARKSMSQPGPSSIVRKRRPAVPKFNVISGSNLHVDAVIMSMSRQFKDTSLKVVQIAGDIRILQVVIGRILNAFIVMRYFYLEKIIVKGQNEDFHNEDGSIDVFTSSQFESMRIITDHAISTLIDLTTTSSHPEVQLKILLVWLCNYKNLFTDKCSICGKHLFAGLPPLWCDFRNSTISHDACRN